MNKLHFGIVLHFHQPVGNFEEVFERAYANCYKPYLELLSNYPDINMTIHFSGSLLDYLGERHPEIIDFINLLASRGQIEIMGGPYYEPILTAIPQVDAIGQMNLMSEYIKEKFGFRPNGVWIPERVWEPGLARLIWQAGIRYCTLDDTLLMKAGMGKEDIAGYVLAGEGRHKIAAFPFDKKLRYLIPFKLPQETIDYLKEVASKREDFLLVYADDGEKFGEWPGTHEWVYKREWLKDFFDLLMSNSDWIELVKLSDYMNSHKPVTTLKIPEGAYDEMMEWAEGPWKNFLSRYPESNQMQKKALYVSSKIEKLKKAAKKADTAKIDEAKKELYKGQCNCAYWHGLYGGLYFYHLRNAVYNHLISAEKIADEILHKSRKKRLTLKQLDFNPGSTKEYVMESETFSLYFDPEDGGVLRELDYRPLSMNLVNTLSRKKEAYHRVSHPIDKYGRYCLRDHILEERLRKPDFTKGTYNECGDFHTSSYTAKKKKETLVLERKSKVHDVGFKIVKQIAIRSEKEIVISYNIEKGDPKAVDILFAVEFNITMPYLNADRYNYMCNGENIGGLNTSGATASANSFGISDLRKELRVSFEFSKTAENIWYFPIKTISQSEKKYGRNYQASCILPRWKPDFVKGKKWDLKISWGIV